MRSSPCHRFVFTVLVIFSLTAVPGPSAFAQSGNTGVVTGRVTDGPTGRALAGATVAVEGTALSTTTDHNGEFRIPAVASGQQNLVVSYPGRKDARVPVQVGTAAVAKAAVTLELDAGYREAVTVTALIRDAQARALNQQKTAPNVSNIVSADQIGYFPDPNAAEVTSRVPGISITRDQGEGRYVIIRGTEPRLNSMLINGERIPSPDPDFRQVAMDVIPADLLQTVEVSKTLTPDMDGDAIGGSVNLVTRRAPERLTVAGSIGGGYNSSLTSADQHNATFAIGRRFNQDKVGFVFGTSTNATRRGNEDFEPVYTSGNLTDLDLRNYIVTRRRHGATGALDFRPRATALYTLQGMYNYYIDDHEERQQYRNRVANRRIERVLRDRTHVEKIWNVSFAGHQDLDRTTLDYRVQGARSSQNDPGTVTSTFRQNNVNFLPNVTPTSIDPDNVQANPQNENLSASNLVSQVRAVNTNADRDIVASLDVRRLAVTGPGLTAFFKTGFKYRDKAKERTRDEVTLTSPTAIPLTSVLEGGNVSHTMLDGRYTVGPFIDLIAADNLQNLLPNSAVNHDRDLEDATTKERTSAVYGMVELYTGPKLFILPGLRVEHFSADYVASDVQYSPTHVWLGTTPITGSHSYTNVLPGVNVRYSLDPNTQLRAAVTRTLARPNYIDQIPNRLFDDQANTVRLGNPDLVPTLAWNADVMVEHYLKSVGILSAGVFYKRLRDYIYTFTSSEVINGETFAVTQPLNGEAASVRGVELAAQSQLTFLPSPFDGLGVYANYTFTDSSAVFPGREGEQARLPGQSRNVGNLAVSYEKGGFAGRLAVNFHGAFIDQVAGTAGQDRIYDTHKQVDLSFSQRITHHVRAYLDALNLTDAPLRYYQGVADRPLQEEHYRWWVAFGLKVNWSGR